MTRLLALAGASAVLLASLGARADVMQDPCDGLQAGDACTTLDQKAGHCADSMGTLDCVEDAPGTGGAGGSGGSSATGGSGTGGNEGDDIDDGGCSMSHDRTVGTSSFAALTAIALGAWLSRRRRRA